MRFLRKKFLTAHIVQFYGMEGMKLKQKTLREICAETGISRRTLQGYEKLGLVASAGKNKYGHLLYGETEQQMIRQIRFYQKLGLTRKGILELMGALDRRKKEVLMELVEQLEAECRQQQELIEQARKYIAML